MFSIFVYLNQVAGGVAKSVGKPIVIYIVSKRNLASVLNGNSVVDNVADLYPSDLVRIICIIGQGNQTFVASGARCGLFDGNTGLLLLPLAVKCHITAGHSVRTCNLVALSAAFIRVPAVEGPAIRYIYLCQMGLLIFVERLSGRCVCPLRLIFTHELIGKGVLRFRSIFVREGPRALRRTSARVNTPRSDDIARIISRIRSGNIESPSSYGSAANLGFFYRLFKLCAVRVLHRNLDRGFPCFFLHAIGSGIDDAV